MTLPGHARNGPSPDGFIYNEHAGDWRMNLVWISGLVKSHPDSPRADWPSEWNCVICSATKGTRR